MREISKEIQNHLNDNHLGEIIRDGYKVSLIVKFIKSHNNKTKLIYERVPLIQEKALC